VATTLFALVGQLFVTTTVCVVWSEYSGVLSQDIDIAKSDCSTSTFTVLTMFDVDVNESANVATNDLEPAEL